MKQLTCEMCGSVNLLKQDGVYVCQDCGTKYSVEEAKKMMVEGKVDVSGSTVKVDDSGKLSNLYQIARRARDDNNSEKAAQYYDQILQQDPDSWEASFYTTYYSAMQTNIAGIASAAVKVNNCLDTVLQLARDNEESEKWRDIVSEISARVLLIGSLLISSAESHYNGISPEIKNKYTEEYHNRIGAVIKMYANLGLQITSIFGEQEDIASLAALPLTSYIKAGQKYLKLSYGTTMSLAQIVGKYNPDYLRQHKKSRIEEIDKSISSIDTQPGPSGCAAAFSGFFFLIGFLMIALGFQGQMSWVAVIGVLEIALGAFLWHLGSKAQKAAIPQKLEQIQRLEKEKAQLQKELDEDK